MNICQGLAAFAVRSSLYEYSYRNYDSVCTKVSLKSDFHIAGQLMETYPEYSNSLVTIEIRNNTIVQAKRRFNDPVTDEDQKAINSWNKKFSNKKEKVA